MVNLNGFSIMGNIVNVAHKSYYLHFASLSVPFLKIVNFLCFCVFFNVKKKKKLASKSYIKSYYLKIEYGTPEIFSITFSSKFCMTGVDFNQSFICCDCVDINNTIRVD